MEGNNKWLAQYPGDQEGVQQPYQDCTCMFDGSKELNPTYVYTKLQDVGEGRRRKQDDKDGGIQYFRSSEVQNEMIIMGHQILSCHVLVVRSFFIL
jgi:hypothetical protein